MSAEDDDASREWLQAFAARVKLAREQVNLSQYDVADLMDLSRGWAFKVEHGILHPHAEQVARLAAALNCDVAWLLTGDGHYQPAHPSVSAMREVQATLTRKIRVLSAMVAELTELNATVAAVLDPDAAARPAPETQQSAPRSDPASSHGQNEGRALPSGEGC